MEILSHYLMSYYLMLVALGGLLIMTRMNSHFGHSTRRILFIAMSELFLLSIVETCEWYCSQLTEPTIWRVLFSFIGYSMRPAIMLTLLPIVVRNRKMYALLWIPEIIVICTYATGFFSKLAFYYDEFNIFRRGPLNYVSLYAALVYFAAFILGTNRFFKEKNWEQAVVLLFLVFTNLFACFLEIHDITSSLNNSTYAIALLLYYLYLHIQISRRDPVTGLLNRSSFYADSGRRGEKITAVISIDMNELKWINDTEGHEAGDAGLIALSECFLASTDKHSFPYRIGGDEFCILCRGASEDDVTALIGRIRDAVAQTRYSCAIGYAMCTPEQSFTQICKTADTAMYADKAEMKRRAAEEGRDLHLRDHQLNYFR